MGENTDIDLKLNWGRRIRSLALLVLLVAGAIISRSSGRSSTEVEQDTERTHHLAGGGRKLEGLSDLTVVSRQNEESSLVIYPPQQQIGNFESQVVEAGVYDLFDCSMEDSKCRYLRPTDFFFSEDGPGYKYRDSLIQMGLKYPGIRHVSRLELFDPPKVEKGTRLHDAKYKTDDFTFFRVRKAASTSMSNAMETVATDLTRKAKFTEYSSFNPELYPGLDEHLAHLASSSAGGRVMEPNRFAFAVVRDPIKRFPSAVVQSMTRDSPDQKKLRERCLRDTTRETLQCVISELESRRGPIDVHFVPMSINLLADVGDADVRTSVFDVGDNDAVSEVLDYFDDLDMEDGYNDFFDRDSSKPSYADSAVLAKLSVSDLTPDMVQFICEFYAVDVELIRHLGFSDVAECN